MTDLKLQMFFCESEKCHLLPKSCIIRQLESNTQTYTRNPMFPMGLINPRYSKCVDCKQGIEIIKQHKEIYNEIVNERKDKLGLKKRGRPKKKPEELVYRCIVCKETDPKLFGKRRDKCLKCRRDYSNAWYAANGKRKG